MHRAALARERIPSWLGFCSLLLSWALIPDMAQLERWERLKLAALRLREIQNETDAIYRRFPDLDRRPKIERGPIRATSMIGEKVH